VLGGSPAPLEASPIDYHPRERQADRISLPVGTITVAGEGRITARPDLAITTLGVDVHAAFTVADAGSLESQARAAAMADARGRAEQLAQLVGAELGPVVQISEGGMVAPLPIEPRGLAPVSHSTPIEGGELAITARIQATYETA